MKPTLYVMVGIPGSGKSTYVKDYLSDCVYVSRDIIRFSLLKTDDSYFAKEDKVFEKYVSNIKHALQNKCDVVADATHISGSSRRKLITAIGKIDYNIIFIVMDTDFQTCLYRNNLRTNITHVPINAMGRMYSQFTYPKKEDFKNCIGVWIIHNNDKT